MGERDDPRGQQLVSGGVELVPCRRDGCADFGKHFGVRPDPVNAVHVDRHGDIVAFVFHDVLNGFRQYAVPVLCRGHIRQIGQSPGFRPFLDVGAFDLHSGRWITGQNTRPKNRGLCVTTAAGDRGINPCTTTCSEGFLQGFDGLRFATGLSSNEAPRLSVRLSGEPLQTRL